MRPTFSCPYPLFVMHGADAQGAVAGAFDSEVPDLERIEAIERFFHFRFASSISCCSFLYKRRAF